MSRSRVCVTAVAAVIAGACWALPASAHAGQLSAVQTHPTFAVFNYTYADAGAERNNAVLNFNSVTFEMEIADSAGISSTAVACTGALVTFRCPWQFASPGSRFSDALFVALGGGDDTLTSTAVVDPSYTVAMQIDAGAGNDLINVVDGQASTVTCGPGSDTVISDPGDAVGQDCEVVVH